MIVFFAGTPNPSQAGERGFEAADVKLVVVVKWLIWTLVVVGVGAMCVSLVVVGDRLLNTFAL